MQLEQKSAKDTDHTKCQISWHHKYAAVLNEIHFAREANTVSMNRNLLNTSGRPNVVVGDDGN